MADYTCYMGNNISAHIKTRAVLNRTYYEIDIMGSGPMYDSVSDFTYPEGQPFNSWEQAVYGCFQDSLVIPEGITTIAVDCFRGLGEWYPRDNDNDRPGVYGVICPESLTEIGDSAFYSVFANNMYKLQYITFGHNVEKIGRYAFNNQRQLKRLEFFGNPTVVNGGAFKDCHDLEYINIAVDWEGLDYSGPSYETFMNCYKLEHINAENKIHTFRGFMYYNCNRLGRVTIDSADFDIGTVRTTSFYVDLFAGDDCDANGNYITQVNTDSYLTPEILAYDWEENWHRVIAYVSFMRVDLCHMGRHISIMCYSRGHVPFKNRDIMLYLRWIKLIDASDANPNQTPIFVKHQGSWYQISY